MSSVYSSLPEAYWNHGLEPISRNRAFAVFECRYERILHDVYHWFLDKQNLPAISVRFDFDTVSSEFAYFQANTKMLVLNVRSIMASVEDSEEVTYTFIETFLHELFHYWQTVTYGVARMGALNLLYNGGAHWLYHQNPLEIEARSFAVSAAVEYLRGYVEEDLV